MAEKYINHFADIRELESNQFDVLYEITKILNSTNVTDSLIEKSLDLVIDTICAERGLFVRYDPENEEFKIIAGRNIEQEKIEDLSEFSSGILQKVIQKKEASIYHDVQSDPDLSQFESVQLQQIKSVIGVPVFHEDKVWGIILADSRVNRKEFSEENLRFFKFFSNLVSLALEKILRFEDLNNENRILRHQLDNLSDIPEMIGRHPEMKQLSNLIKRVSATDATVLILGESGTGKDLAARAIHELSSRKGNPFLAQFCGSIPDSLLESELFGYKKGAFTGAKEDKKGLFEVAHNGTFFLDEIADISMALQAKLLRVIQNQEIIRLGDTAVRKVNVRLIAATNKDLKTLVKQGKFREDLFYRLNVFPITVPPLRERGSDISLLARHFIDKYAEGKITLSTAALIKLENFIWPGNVRQLENVIQRALILCDGSKINSEHIILEDDPDQNELYGTLREIEQAVLINRLKKFDGNRTKTADSLGVSVRWIQLKLKEMNIQ